MFSNHDSQTGIDLLIPGMIIPFRHGVCQQREHEFAKRHQGEWINLLEFGIDIERSITLLQTTNVDRKEYVKRISGYMGSVDESIS